MARSPQGEINTNPVGINATVSASSIDNRLRHHLFIAMESVRKSLRADLSPKQRRGLIHDRFVLLRRQNQLTDQESFNLDGWTKNYPLLGEAYRLKEEFFNIYQASSKQQAQILYAQWLKSIPAELRLRYLGSAPSADLSHFLMVLRVRLVRLEISLMEQCSRKNMRRILAYMTMVITSFTPAYK